MTCTLLDGDLFREMLLQSWHHLSEHKKEVDALNVFPVPDGDTGTNMHLTLSSAVDSLKGRSGLTVGQASEIASLGALMGARGNSGVILSQIFRGISKGFAGKSSAGPKDIALAFEEAVVTAYKAVMKPVEGTILTVLRGMRDAAAAAAASNKATIKDVLYECVVKGEAVLAKTQDMLPALKQAGVVDAGGKGLLYIMEGALAWCKGVKTASGQMLGLEQHKPEAVPNVTEDEITHIDNPYDTQLLIVGENLKAEDITKDLDPLGDSLLVVGSDTVIRVHIHTSIPEQVIGVCIKYGQLSQVTIDNMIEQSRQVLQERSRLKAENASEPPSASSFTQAPAKELAIISVATGSGLKSIMTSLGCDLVMDGGITMNPSTSDLVEAFKTVGAKKVIFLPNNANIFLAAKQAKKLTGRSMYIIPSKTVPQGISALLSLNLNEDMKSNIKRAGRAIRSVKTGEVTFAARNGRFGRIVMKEGDIIGLTDGKVEAVGSNPENVLKTIVKSMVGKNDAVVTVYYGQDVSDSTAQSLTPVLQELVGEKYEVEVHMGGQPLYYYIVSVE